MKRVQMSDQTTPVPERPEGQPAVPPLPPVPPVAPTAPAAPAAPEFAAPQAPVAPPAPQPEFGAPQFDEQPTVAQPTVAQPTVPQPEFAAPAFAPPGAAQPGQPGFQAPGFEQQAQYPGAPFSPQGYPGQQKPKSNGLALSALIVGIASLVLCAFIFTGIIGGAVAVVLGIIALNKAQSKGMAITGIVTGGLALLAAIGILITSVALVGEIARSGDTTIAELEKLTEQLEEEATAPTEAPAEEEPAATGEWTEVITMTGSADQQSDTFTLSGGKVRLTYDFQDTSGYGIIVGGIYVVEEGKDIMVDGGIPEVMVTEAGAGETILRKAAGDYYLKATGSGASYTITIEEMR